MRAERPELSLGFLFLTALLTAPSSQAMNHNIVHRTPLDTARVRAGRPETPPFADGLFRANSSGAPESPDPS